MYYTNDGITIYMGDMVQGDREATVEEVALYETNKLDSLKVKEISMAQFRAALITLGLKQTVDSAVASSGDELLINDYEYRTTVKRDWPSFTAMAIALGKTDADIDGLFELGSAL